jgi:hypothetical protein
MRYRIGAGKQQETSFIDIAKKCGGRYLSSGFGCGDGGNVFQTFCSVNYVLLFAYVAQPWCLAEYSFKMITKLRTGIPSKQTHRNSRKA